MRSRYEGALLLLLRHRRWGTPLLACCSHLYWNPSFPDVKAAQATVLCRRIREFLQQQVQQGALASDDVAVVIGGDFNSLWRKYRSDQFDVVSAAARPWPRPAVLPPSL
jgi:CCR4-NOT transcription complex subunit 6